ncbi:hypothetical protein RI367_006641 [Sorochytrium milnesiophthora]
MNPSNNVKIFAAWLNARCAQLPGQYFAPYTSIVQSSGCGKSRLIKELANEGIWVFYICLRKQSRDDTPGAAGYPCRSTIADHKALSPVTTAEDDCRDNCCYLLAACMTHLTDLVEENRTNPIEFLKKQLAYDDNIVSGGEFWKQVQKVEMQLLATPQQTPAQPRSEKEKKQMLSQRAKERGVDLFPPFIDLAFFDIHRPDDMDEDVCKRVQQYISSPKAGKQELDILADLQLFQARDGRPLFAVEGYRTPTSNDEVKLGRLQRLAVAKLCGGMTPAALRRPKTEDDNNDSDNGIDIDIDNASLLSALQFHAAFEVNPSQKIASDMVGACMSVCGFVSEDRRSISVRAPSESFLAQAPGTLLYDAKKIQARPLYKIFRRLPEYIRMDGY